MNMSVHLLVALTAVCLCVAQASPEMRTRTKQQRPTRGFKNVEMMTARGFGKRDRPTRSELYSGEQPEETFWESLEAAGELEAADSRDDKRDRSKTDMRQVRGVRKSMSKLDRKQESVKSMKASTSKKGENKNRKDKFKDDTKKRKLPKSSKSKLGSITVDIFTKEMVKNPDFAKTVVRRFIDHNLDGYLTEDELLKVNA